VIGQVEDLRKNFSLFSVLGISFSLANSWFGISTALVAGINAGGPVQLVYGTIIVSIVCLCIGVSLAELASAMPNAGGQYYWTSQLAGPSYARFASYLTGWVAWAGALFTCASIALGVGTLCVGCIQMAHPDL
jgi:choline transport protein